MAADNAAERGRQRSTGNSNMGMQDLEAGGPAADHTEAGKETTTGDDGPSQGSSRHSPARGEEHEMEILRSSAVTTGTELLEEVGELELHNAVWQRSPLDIMALQHNLSLGGKRDSNGMAPLYLAIHLGNINIARNLIEMFGGALSCEGPNGQNVLHIAAVRTKDFTDLILEWQENLWDQADKYGSKPLHFAASVGIKGVTGSLVLGAQSVVMTQPDKSGMCPIHIAASVGAMDAIRALVARDKSLSTIRDANGDTFLHVAVANKNANVVKYVCREVNLEGILNLTNRDGNTALHLAVEKRDETIFSYLLGNRRVELNHINKKGYTPLDLATKIKVRYLHGSPKNPTEWMIRAVAHSGAQFSARRRDMAWSTQSTHHVWAHVVAQNRDEGLQGPVSQKHHDENLAMSAEETQKVKGAVTVQNDEGDLARSDKEMQNVHGVVTVQSDEGDLGSSTEATQNLHGAETIRNHEVDLARSTESVLVASALIATLTFAAAVTVPGSYKTDQGTPALGRSYGFKVFLVADILAFYCSVAATFSLAEYGNRGNVDPLVRCTYAQRAIWFFHVALKSVIVAFALGVSVVMWDISLITTIIVAIFTICLVLYGNESLAHDHRLMWVMYCRFGFTLSWNLYPSTSFHLDWRSRRLQSFSATLAWNTFKLFWTYAFIFLVAYIAQLKQKSVK